MIQNFLNFLMYISIFLQFFDQMKHNSVKSSPFSNYRKILMLYQIFKYSNCSLLRNLELQLYNSRRLLSERWIKYSQTNWSRVITKVKKIRTIEKNMQNPPKLSSFKNTKSILLWQCSLYQDGIYHKKKKRKN